MGPTHSGDGPPKGGREPGTIPGGGGIASDMPLGLCIVGELGTVIELRALRHPGGSAGIDCGEAASSNFVRFK